MPTPGVHTFLNEPDRAKLQQYVSDHACGTEYRHTYEDDPTAAAREHTQEKCRWWHKGQTIVGAPGFDPEARLRQEA